MRGFMLIQLLFLALGAPALAADSARQVIPPGSEARVLALLAPYGVEAPHDRIGDGVLIDSVKIEGNRVAIRLLRGESSALVALGPRGGTAAAGLETPSFLVTTELPGDDVLLGGASNLLVEAIGRNDDGSFWGGMVELPPPHDPDYREIPDGPTMRWYDYLGELLLLSLVLLLGMSSPLWLANLRRYRWTFWALLALLTGLGLLYRVQLMGGSADSPRSGSGAPTCKSDSDCEEGSDCTDNRCVEGQCVVEWRPAAGLDCCRSDADCAPSEMPCWERVCDPVRKVCFERPESRCFPEHYEGGDFPMATSLSWLYSVMAKWEGNRPGVAAPVNKVASVVGTAVLALALLAFGLRPSMVLWSAFFYALSPLSLVTAPADSLANLFLLFGLLYFFVLGIALDLPASASRLSVRALLGAGTLCFFVLATARPEAFVLLPLTGWLWRRRGTAAGWPELGIAAFGPLAAVVVVAVGGLDLWGRWFAPWNMGLSLESFSAGMHLLFLDGEMVPFLALLLALPGGLALWRGSRPAALLAALGLASLLLMPAIVGMEDGTLLRYLLLPSMALVALAGAGCDWLTRRDNRNARLVALVLVVYFLLFPLFRSEPLLGLMNSQIVEDAFYLL